MIRHLLSIWCLLACASVSLNAKPLGPSTAQQSFDVQTSLAPQLVSIGGKTQLVYELHFTNFANKPVRITGIAVFGSDEKTPIADYEGEALNGVLGSFDAKQAVVPPGSRTVAYFDVPIAAMRPKLIGHRLKYVVEGQASISELWLDPMSVEPVQEPVLGPPLRGGPWVALYDPALDRGHRRVIYAVAGRAKIPGRFAVDFIRLDDHGAMAPKGANSLSQYVGFGASVIAVADGTIAAIHDGFEQVELLADLPDVPIGDAAGNYVVIDIGNNRFAFYEHLQPGLDVRIGQRIRKGDVIGKLGLTGQGSEPHLHFHIADWIAPLNAEGVPFVFDELDIVGSYDSISSAVGGHPWKPAAATLKATMPAPNSVVQFPEEPVGR